MNNAKVIVWSILYVMCWVLGVCAFSIHLDIMGWEVVKSQWLFYPWCVLVGHCFFILFYGLAGC